MEYHLNGRRGVASEYYFELKNGKRVGYETSYYDSEEGEKYLEETRIVFQKRAVTDNEENKELLEGLDVDLKE